MDAGRLLLEARDRLGLSQQDLATRAGTYRSVVSAYERGAKSPTVRTLNALLAAVGLEVRGTLGRLLADVDARVDEWASGTPTVDVAAIELLASLAESEQRWGLKDEETGEVTWYSERVRWALDGATALNVQGLACPHDFLCLALEFDDAARKWLDGGLMRGTARARVPGWWDCTLEEAERELSDLAVGMRGVLKVRPVARLEGVLDVRLPGCATVVPVLGLDQVERGNPDLGEVLVRMRERRLRGDRVLHEERHEEGHEERQREERGGAKGATAT